MNSLKLWCHSITVLYLSGLVLIGAETGDFPSLTEIGPYETSSRYACGTVTYNLGPTGARGWARAFNGGPLFWGENGREILITHVDQGSPADGKLQVFDVIVGADGKTFDDDARVCLGNAIARAQRDDGVLSLQRWRNGKTGEVKLTLPRLPGDSVVAPLSAEASKALREQVYEFILESMPPDGFDVHPSYACLNALYLLASDRPESLEYVRRHVRRVVAKMEESEYGPWNWEKGPETVLLAEYFLKTGDRSVLPTIKQYCEWMKRSQSYAGGWGHGGPYGGYGHVGLPGMYCAIGLILARECGVTGFDDVIEKARIFYARGAGLGMVSYGGFSASTSLKTIYGDNGKSGTAAVLYDCFDDETTGRFFANTACALAPYSESGHTGHFWSFSWGALGANKGSEPNRKYFASTLDWYYALARTWRGGMTAQPWMNSMASYSPGGEELATGGMALWYCEPLKTLRILGGEKGVLSKDLVKPLAAARQLIYDKRYAECVAALVKFVPGDDVERLQAAELNTIAERQLGTIRLTRESIRSNIEKGDLYVAERQLNALKPVVRNAKEIADLEALLSTDQSKARIAAGKDYYEAMKYAGSPDREFFYRAPAVVFNAKLRQSMQEIADSATSGSYAAMAKDALALWEADVPGPEYETLVEKEVHASSPARMFLGRSSDAKAGVCYQYVEFDVVPDSPRELKKMEPVKEGVADGFVIPAVHRGENFGFVFKSFVEIEQDGEYVFTLTSDDGSVLFLDGKELIDNGGLHGMTPKEGNATLTAGRHELECMMFQGRAGFGLKVEMKARQQKAMTSRQDLPFEVRDHESLGGLKVSVKAADPVAVLLNGEMICRFHKKRKEGMFDGSWKEWEEVTLRPEALALLRAGKNVLGVETKSSQLGGKGAAVGVKLMARTRIAPEK